MKKYIAIRIAALRFFSGFVIALERATACFWRGVVAALFFCALWLFEIPSFFGMFGKALTFFAFIGSFGFLFYRDGRSFRWPSERDIDRRIERDSAVKGRPLSSKGDNLANPHKHDTRNLWALARGRLHGLLPFLKPAKVRSFMAENDPYALRLGVLMAFCLGLIAAGAEWKPRIAEGLTPFSVTSSGGEKPDDYTIWITPPDYTQLSQMVLNDKTIEGETLRIPQGSTLKAIVNGGFGKPSLSFGDTVLEFDIGDDRSYGLEVSVPDDAQNFALKQSFFTKAMWGIEIIPDVPPEISLTEETPEVLDNGQIRFPITLKDDYGVETLVMRMELDAMVEDAPLGQPFSEERSVLSPPAQSFPISPVYDLTAHNWAGLPAVFTFTAKDKIGQTTELAAISMILPERHFEHPVAKTLVALRKQLAWQPTEQSVYASTEHDLRILLTEPDIFQNDILVYMALRSAIGRLDYNPPSVKIADEVMRLMWDTALRVEDGDLSLTARKLREAQMALEDALKDGNMSDEEIAALMSELRSAMADYFQELAREFQKRQAEGEYISPLSPEALAQALSPEALADFLDQMEAQLQDGDPQSAQEMLSQLQRLLDTLNPSMNAELPPDMQMMQQGINELEELIKRQEALLEQTEQQANVLNALKRYGFDYGQSLEHNREILERWGLSDLPPPPEKKDAPALPFLDTTANTAEQEALRYVLGQLMLDANEVLDKIPESMGLAENEMRGSAEKLGAQRPDFSAPHQERAIEYLKESQEQLAQQMQQRVKQMTGFSLSFGGPQRYDPLGRPIMPDGDSNGGRYGSHAEIPDEAERRRVQEILKLLRQRSGQQNRPRVEREYYRRLLKRF